MEVNKLILGDNLEILKTIEIDTIDLIYLDPPFFSNRNYEVIWGDEGEVRSFQDRWSGGIDHYITWLQERVEQMHRILKPTGSIFLHCDWHANAYIRVDILDKIFGTKNFRNEIVWHYIMGASARSTFGEKYDTIYWYSKTKTYTFNLDAIRVPYNPETIARSQRGEARYNKVLTEKDGKNPGNVWCDINPIQGNGRERIGYPTQKPEALLSRIIKAASNEGEIVLDPFVGGGTTIAVADRLNRKWIGIDQSVQAVKVTEMRLDKQRGFFSAPFTVQLHKYDYDTLRYSNAFEFESWIVQQFGGVSNTKQRGDYGLDGKMLDNTPIQVKCSDNIGRNVIDNFLSAVKRADKKLYEKNIEGQKPIGYIIAFTFGKGAVSEVARLKLKENIIIELVTVEKIVPIAKKPSIAVTINELTRDEKGFCEIEFIAKGQSESGIEFYSWDFNHNLEQGFRADVMLDKSGRQTAKFKAGHHNIAVKVVDNDGLENVDAFGLRVNGIVERT
jgi:DNA modification methylase